eukprot:c16526_g1_i2 orf=171-788(-)
MDSFNIVGTTFTIDNVQEFQRLCNSPQECLRCMSEVLDLKDYLTKARQAFVLDYFHGINVFAAEVDLSMEQALIVFNFGKDLLCTLLALILPLSEASSKEELEAQELAAKEALEAEDKARQAELEKAEAERVAAEEAIKIEESKKKPESLDEALDFIVRENLESFKQSFFEGCASEQKRLIEKLAQLEANVTAGTPSESKAKKPQ